MKWYWWIISSIIAVVLAFAGMTAALIHHDQVRYGTSRMTCDLTVWGAENGFFLEGRGGDCSVLKNNCRRYIASGYACSEYSEENDYSCGCKIIQGNYEALIEGEES